MKGTVLLGILAILVVIVGLATLIVPNNVIVDDVNATILENVNIQPVEDEKIHDIGLPYEQGIHTEMFCEDICGNGVCDELIYLDVDSTCYETHDNCPIDCD